MISKIASPWTIIGIAALGIWLIALSPVSAKPLINPDLDCSLASYHYSEMTKIWVSDSSSPIARVRIDAAYNEAMTRYQRKCNP